MYNGYADQDAFHAALQADMARYAADVAARPANDPGMRHASCDHAYGYCAESADGTFRAR